MIALGDDLTGKRMVNFKLTSENNLILLSDNVQRSATVYATNVSSRSDATNATDGSAGTQLCGTW